ncbi:MAG: hypothetical protein CML68_18250 [Rhodobacteraceae bacterium]|nr:hypothetical protein [Paracoccaceae bacterium]
MSLNSSLDSVARRDSARRLGRALGLSWSASLWFLTLAIAFGSWALVTIGIERAMPHMAYHARLRPVALYSHVILAPAALALVPFQLWHGLRRRRAALHRWLGRVYGVVILLASLSGFWLAVTTEAGSIAAFGFGLLAIVWLGTTVIGIGEAMQGDYIAHRRWIIRSVAATLAAVTLRLLIIGSEVAGWDSDGVYQAIAWLCWVPNMILAELYLRLGPTRQRRVA